MSKQANADVRAMRAEIARLTGRAPESRDPEYLRTRLNDILKSHPLHVTMPTYASEILSDCASFKRCSTAELLRRALAYYVTNHMGRVDDGARLAEATRGE